jgi:hypothetical protein
MNADDSNESISSNAKEMIIPPSVTINNQQVIGAISGDIDFEIVGLFSSSNGRFCCMHKTCGEHVCVGDVLRLVKTIIVIGTTSEEVIKLVKIIDGTDACGWIYTKSSSKSTKSNREHQQVLSSHRVVSHFR